MLLICDPVGVIGGYYKPSCYRYQTPLGSLAASTGLHVTDMRPRWGHWQLLQAIMLQISDPFGVIIFHFYHTTRFVDSLLQAHQVDIHAPMVGASDNAFHKKALLPVHRR